MLNINYQVKYSLLSMSMHVIMQSSMPAGPAHSSIGCSNLMNPLHIFTSNSIKGWLTNTSNSRPKETYIKEKVSKKGVKTLYFSTIMIQRELSSRQKSYNREAQTMSCHVSN
jgi:hypothetical protein